MSVCRNILRVVFTLGLVVVAKLSQAGPAPLQVQYSTVQYSTALYWQTDKREYCKLFDHMALIVDLGGQNYLVDVGFGNISQPSEPIRCKINFFLPPVTCALVDF